MFPTAGRRAHNHVRRGCWPKKRSPLCPAYRGTVSVFGCKQSAQVHQNLLSRNLQSSLNGILPARTGPSSVARARAHAVRAGWSVMGGGAEGSFCLLHATVSAQGMLSSCLKANCSSVLSCVCAVCCGRPRIYWSAKDLVSEPHCRIHWLDHQHRWEMRPRQCL